MATDEAAEPLTFGTISRDGALPDYVAVSDQQGNLAGYVSREALLRGDYEPIPVHDTEMRVVGCWVNGRGFVRTGQDSASLPSTARYTIGHADGSIETGTIGLDGEKIPDPEPDPRFFPPHLRPKS
jgi:hypothetical protein